MRSVEAVDAQSHLDRALHEQLSGADAIIKSMHDTYNSHLVRAQAESGEALEALRRDVEKERQHRRAPTLTATATHLPVCRVLHVHVHVMTCMCACSCAHVARMWHAYLRVCAQMYARAHMHVCIGMCASKHVCVCACVACIHACICVCTRLHPPGTWRARGGRIDGWQVWRRTRRGD